MAYLNMFQDDTKKTNKQKKITIIQGNVHDPVVTMSWHCYKYSLKSYSQKYITYLNKENAHNSVITSSPSQVIPGSLLDDLTQGVYLVSITETQNWKKSL